MPAIGQSVRQPCHDSKKRPRSCYFIFLTFPVFAISLPQILLPEVAMPLLLAPYNDSMRLVCFFSRLIKIDRSDTYHEDGSSMLSYVAMFEIICSHLSVGHGV